MTDYHPEGEKHYATKLTANDVLTIRQLHSEGVSLQALAVEYGLNKSTVWAIVNRRSWRHV